ncbi:neuropeptide Y receptor type 5-like [Acipenser oxyrinchus oxyrinchus]|uniref:Neuropeptide Y receptor type 5 n=1 Tax=Acipenser oxyrinchus oxyrinchus TaxID=40147 RepID=A0AAD8LTY8_ACIOX|nr:neuropeptide Y receptor type 5-like [Acipenser oxyrinchus oxyrinchus]
MDLVYSNRSDVTSENESSALYRSFFPSWEDFNSSVDDIRYFVIGVYTFVSLLGLLGNVLILLALIRKWKEKTVMNFLVGNLAFSDILVVLFCSPFTLTCVLLDHWIFGDIMCHIVPFLQCVCVLVSTLMLMSIAMVRYHMISHPLSRHLTVNTGYLLLGIIWTLGLCICSPLSVFHKTIELRETFHLDSLKNKFLCIESWPSDKYRIAFTITLLFVQYILPIVCLTVSHASVCRRVSSSIPNQQVQPKENEMIDLTLHQSDRQSCSPPQLSNSERWRLSIARKQRKRYSKKCSSVMPVMYSHNNDSGELLHPKSKDQHTPPSNILLPGVPVCFELKAEENTEWQKMLRTSKSISRMKKRSKSVFYKLTIVILAFAISWMPLHIFHLVADFGADLISSKHFKLVYCICHLLGMLSCCLNPILYGFLNNGIKADLISLIKCFYIS